MIGSVYYDLTSIPEFNQLINNNEITDLNILNKRECEVKNNKYKVIRYNKNILSTSLIPTYGLCRSVILNSENKVLSFSPPKSISSDEFIINYDNSDENLIVEEFVEGTMINVFWDKNCGLTGCWEIATRNSVGAETSFYKYNNAKTFRTMFLEAVTANNLNLDMLNRDYSYSFVLQHPENRIVVPFFKPQLYLVAVYLITQIKKEKEQIGIVNVFPANMSVVKEYNSWKNTTIKFPEQYSFQSYSELIEKYASMNTPYNILGVVIYSRKTGERCKIRNPVYEQVRQLKGNQPKLQYQYLVLRNEGKVVDYLNYYPESKKIFSQFRDQVHLFTNTLFSNYLSCYIKKEKPLIEFSEQYRSHMFKLHQKYLSELREKKLFINNTLVIKYVNSLHPSQLMFSINYPMRKRNVDTIKTENIEEPVIVF